MQTFQINYIQLNTLLKYVERYFQVIPRNQVTTGTKNKELRLSFKPGEFALSKKIM